MLFKTLNAKKKSSYETGKIAKVLAKATQHSKQWPTPMSPLSLNLWFRPINWCFSWDNISNQKMTQMGEQKILCWKIGKQREWKNVVHKSPACKSTIKGQQIEWFYRQKYFSLFITVTPFLGENEMVESSFFMLFTSSSVYVIVDIGKATDLCSSRMCFRITNYFNNFL